ncbi:hypothetical protein [Flavobacterium hydrophilum]|uniref:Uncharacterized protein n=1 Tax=Flavobacterium hydrophilum TaxID=2211445 RepID=A0A2V4CAR8_9FLAO|nr:hypothetical protein [Flavobacterium hydrophilum]PXY47243.1 hypothetical protein DMB68_08880 [Flavobacterium hydrophilum]
MILEIIQKGRQSLFVYQDGNLLFYSVVKFNWINRIINIYNQNDDLLLELKCRSFFMKSNYKILFQNQSLNPFINEINSRSITFNTDKYLTVDSKYFISFNYNYYFRDTKIAELKKKIFSISSKMTLELNDENLEFSDQIIMHILSIETGVSVD